MRITWGNTCIIYPCDDMCTPSTSSWSLRRVSFDFAEFHPSSSWKSESQPLFALENEKSSGPLFCSLTWMFNAGPLKLDACEGASSFSSFPEPASCRVQGMENWYAWKEPVVRQGLSWSLTLEQHKLENISIKCYAKNHLKTKECWDFRPRTLGRFCGSNRTNLCLIRRLLTLFFFN